MRIFRAVIAIVLALLGLWCLFWLPLFVVLSGVAESDNSNTDYLALGAFMLLFFGAAYLIQPWWRHPWQGRPKAT